MYHVAAVAGGYPLREGSCGLKGGAAPNSAPLLGPLRLAFFDPCISSFFRLIYTASLVEIWRESIRLPESTSTIFGGLFYLESRVPSTTTERAA